ncbi:hypothetical protein [Trichocoleus desertorum]|uniref:Uncharacterized protein n=1 Tax=Trichocoleus desertorum GB2-A4 TaxID=2933944 RepID=A0ABV0J488_9CYAN
MLGQPQEVRLRQASGQAAQQVRVAWRSLTTDAYHRYIASITRLLLACGYKPRAIKIKPQSGQMGLGV